ncbi:HPP family protein [Candidatus Aenigmatarchaeota archaeon]
MKVKDVMTRKPLCLKQGDKIQTAIHMLSRNDISSCPIVDGQKKVVGIVTKTDVLKSIDAHSGIQNQNALTLVMATITGEEYDGIKRSIKKVIKRPVKSIMKKKVLCISDKDDIYKAAKLMNERDIETLPVVRNNKIIGILTRSDIISLLGKIDRR